MGLHYMRRVIQRRAKFDIMELDTIEVCSTYSLHDWIKLNFVLFLYCATLSTAFLTKSLINYVCLFSFHQKLLSQLYLDMQVRMYLSPSITQIVFTSHMR